MKFVYLEGRQAPVVIDAEKFAFRELVTGDRMINWEDDGTGRELIYTAPGSVQAIVKIHSEDGAIAS
jgi:hypothetical protein